ncbi:MAG: GNAT family N-acetyltransferase [Planctomycetes bacterium]|nr:GNAT family N-acetyltransferase [Planctomycetota bacterium]
MITFRKCENTNQLHQEIQPWLQKDPVPHTLITGILNSCPELCWCATMHLDQIIVAAMVQSPGRPLVLVSPIEPSTEMIKACVNEAAKDNRIFNGFNGPHAWATAISNYVNCPIITQTDLALHKLEGKPQLPNPVPGTCRAFTDEELPMLQQWDQDFALEACPESPNKHYTVAELSILQSNCILWECNSTIVSMARKARPCLGGFTISGVYTPPAFRGQGYAGAAVHGLSQNLLQQGATYLALYTDLSNPTANSLYKKIGYTAILKQTQIIWNPNE